MTTIISRAGISETDITPDSEEWIDWFTSQPAGTKIQFEWTDDSCKAERFTAYRRKRYWECQKRVSGKLRNTTIKSEDVTYQALREIGLRLTAYNWSDKFEIEKSGKSEEYQTQSNDSSQTQELEELRKENEALRERISQLLDERGAFVTSARADDKQRITQLEQQVKQFDNANWELEKRYTTSEELSRKRLEQLQTLQARHDSLVEALRSAKRYKLRGDDVVITSTFEPLL